MHVALKLQGSHTPPPQSVSLSKLSLALLLQYAATAHVPKRNPVPALITAGADRLMLQIRLLQAD
jgi:hypothetical protein